MEGRDIGSVVFPETPYKFYVDASPEIRSQRRAAQGQTDQIAARDQADSSRTRFAADHRTRRGRDRQLEPDDRRRGAADYQASRTRKASLSRPISPLVA